MELINNAFIECDNRGLERLVSTTTAGFFLHSFDHSDQHIHDGGEFEQRSLPSVLLRTSLR